MIVPPPHQPNPPVDHADASSEAVSRAQTLFASFGFAFSGLWHLLVTQRNARIHCAFGVMAVILGLLLGISRIEWIALVLTIALVLVLEGFNTAVEAVVDLASPGHHSLAKIAKDVAAGTVLLAAIASVVVGVLIFLPYLLALLQAWINP